MTVGGFSYRTIISDRVKPIKSAPVGYDPTWKEHVQIIVGTDPKDTDFSRFMRRMARRAEDDEGDPCDSFDACDVAGSVDIGEELISASPDLISVSIGTWSYEAGMPHPHSQGVRNYIWSRRLHRLIREADVFARRPDRALRKLALSNFDNREAITSPDDPNGIPLDWNHASIGPRGISWFFDSYELGGYPSAGTATISWSELRPYLRRKLPFAIDKIRSAPSRFAR
jgi:hypothetical protein